MNKDILQKLANQDLCIREIAIKLNITNASARYRLNKYGIKTNRKKTSAAWTTTKDQLEKLVAESKSLAEVLRKLGYKNHLTSNLYNSLKSRLKKDSIDYSHIKLGLNSNKGRSFKRSKKEVIEELIIRPRLYGNDKLRLIRYNIIPHENCSICNQNRVWNKKTLTLQIDHIDGNSKNNHPNNLRFVCPNCHSQTETFCGKNIK